MRALGKDWEAWTSLPERPLPTSLEGPALPLLGVVSLASRAQEGARKDGKEAERGRKESSESVPAAPSLSWAFLSLPSLCAGPSAAAGSRPQSGHQPCFTISFPSPPQLKFLEGQRLLDGAAVQVLGGNGRTQSPPQERGKSTLGLKEKPEEAGRA